MKHIIVTGGISAGKTTLCYNIISNYNVRLGSPASILKNDLAEILARGLYGRIDSNPSPFRVLDLRQEMDNQETKSKYRELLQAYGEWFSNNDPSYWINRVVEGMKKQLEFSPNIFGTIYDSIRRPGEIEGILNVFPDAIRVHIEVLPERQIEYLTKYLGYDLKRAEQTINHESEHWLKDYKGVPTFNVIRDSKNAGTINDQQIYEVVKKCILDREDKWWIKN